jgi:mannosyltransferase
MAVSPFDVQFGQEARPYTLFSCLVLLALWGLVRIAQGRQKGVFISWAAYTIGTIGTLNVLLGGFFGSLHQTSPWLQWSEFQQ